MERPLTPVPQLSSRKTPPLINAVAVYPIVNEEEQIFPKHNAVVVKSKIFTESFTKLKEIIKDDEINALTIINILRTAMEMIETIKELKGSEQKDFAVLLVRELIAKSKLSKKEKQNCLMIVDMGILDNVVDLVVDSSKGNLAINTKKRIKKLFSCCCKK